MINLTIFIGCIKFLTKSINVYYILLGGKALYQKKKKKEKDSTLRKSNSGPSAPLQTHKQPVNLTTVCISVLFSTRNS